jgi:twinkle protein
MGNQLKAHQPCPDCGSSDALAVYDWGTKCYACEAVNVNDKNSGEHKRRNMTLVSNSTSAWKEVKTLNHPSEDSIFKSVPERGISRATMEFFGVKSDGQNYWFPYTDGDGKIVAYKKRGITEKKFSTTGDWSNAQLFGMSHFAKGGKYVTLVEGEHDCSAAFQMLGSKFPVVSIRNGAASASVDVRKYYKWLDSFDNVVVFMDNDEQGKAAVEAITKVLGSKIKVFKPQADYKDACDYLSRGDDKLFMDTWWKAERHVPEGIVSSSSLREEVLKRPTKAVVRYPFQALDEMTMGIREAELVTVTAGSGLGKSQFIRELAYSIFNQTNDNFGIMFLEEDKARTARSLMSLHLNKPIHLPDTEVSDEELADAYNALLKDDRFYFYDHFGSNSIDTIVDNVRYFARALNCKYIYLDHVSIVVSAQEASDERKAIDEIMTKLRMLVQETGITLFLVSHLKRPEGKGFEDGAQVSVSALRGSGSIAQLSDIVIGLERSSQHPDLTERNTTQVRVLKNRHSGQVGPAGRLLYDLKYGRMCQRLDEEDENAL